MKELIDNFKDVLKNKYAKFDGRASRKEYWLFQAMMLAIVVVLGILGNMFPMGGGVEMVLMIILGLVMLGMFLPSLALFIRRLHDIDKSGWWFLIGIIPLIGAIVTLVFSLTEGTKGDNRFGADPYKTIG